MSTELNTKDLEIALQSGTSFHPLSSFFPEDEKQGINQRIRIYKKYWEAYSSTGKIITDDSSEDANINFCRLAVHKSTDWLFGKSWVLTCPPGNDAIADAVMEVWEENEKDLICQTCGNQGAVTGDPYFHVTYKNPNDFSEGFVISPVSAQYVYPVFDPFMPRKLVGVMIQFPIHVVNEAKEFSVHRASVDGNTGAAFRTYFTQYITANQITEYHGNLRVNTYPNPFGEINVFHCQNIITGSSPFGESDLADLYKLDRGLTRIADKIGETIDYHAGPTTVITGASADSLESGADNIWAIKSDKARVQTLSVSGDLAGSGAHFERLRSVRSELSEIPLAALGGSTGISNTSNAALEVLFMPLLEKTRRKRISYSYLITSVSSFLARQIHKENVSLVRKLKDKKKSERFGVKWESPLPRDETVHIADTLARLNGGVISRAEAVLELADPDVDIQDRLLKILADERARVLVDFEKFKAAAGHIPNITSVRTGSIGLAIQNQEALDEQDDLIFEYAEKMESVSPQPEPEQSDQGNKQQPLLKEDKEEPKLEEKKDGKEPSEAE